MESFTALSFVCSSDVALLHSYLEPVDLWRLASTCRTAKTLLLGGDTGYGVYRNESDWKQWLEKYGEIVKKKYPSGVSRYWCTQFWSKEMNWFFFRYALYLSYNMVYDLPLDMCRHCCCRGTNNKKLVGWYLYDYPANDVHVLNESTILEDEESKEYMQGFPGFLEYVLTTPDSKALGLSMPICNNCCESISSSLHVSWPLNMVVLGREFYVSHTC